MASDSDVDSLAAQWEQTKVAEQKKDCFLENVLNALRQASRRSKELEDKCDRLDIEKSMLHSRLKDSLDEQSTLQRQIERKAFVLVLIDGDNTLFLDNFVQRGTAGGRDAAIALYTFLMEAIQADIRSTSELDIVVKIYANKRGLTRTYRRSGVMPDGSRVGEFMEGFNKERTLFEFVDAADDGQAADRKIEGNLELFWSLPQCKRIVLAGSGDRGYVGFLRQYTQSPAQCKRLALLQARPFHRDWNDIVSRVDVVEAPTLFRKDPLSESSSAQAQPPSTPNSNAALTRSSAATSSTQSSSSCTQPSKPPKSRDSTTIEVGYNAAGHRIDPHLRIDTRLRDRFMSMSKRHCFDHHLSHCSKPKSKCAFTHGEPLTALSYDTLVFVARLHPCRSRSCSRPACYFGHHCPYGVRCNRSCKFSEERHEGDMTVVRTMRG